MRRRLDCVSSKWLFVWLCVHHPFLPLLLSAVTEEVTENSDCETVQENVTSPVIYIYISIEKYM